LKPLEQILLPNYRAGKHFKIFLFSYLMDREGLVRRTGLPVLCLGSKHKRKQVKKKKKCGQLAGREFLFVVRERIPSCATVSNIV
jgi:hypothetical protein